MMKIHRYRSEIALTLFFILSRIFYYQLGVRFDITGLAGFNQYVDVRILQDHLFQTVFYLNSKPPLFFLFLGTVLKWFPNHYPQVFNGVYLFCGWLLVMCLYRILRFLDIRNLFCFVSLMMFMIHPAVILYDNWCFYAYPHAVLLCLSVSFLIRFSVKKTFKDAVAFFIIISFLMLSRSVFHPLWFFCLMIFLLLHFKLHRRTILLAACIPMLIVFSVYLKNYILFGTQTFSPYLFGFQLSRMTVAQLPREKLKQLVDEGRISPFTALEVRDPRMFELYKPHFFNFPETGVKVLDQLYNSNGSLNMNNLGFVKLGKLFKKDSLYVFRHFPDTYLKSLGITYLLYFFPAPVEVYFKNRQIIHPIERVFQLMFIPFERSADIYSSRFNDPRSITGLRWDGLSRLAFSMVVLLYLLSIANVFRLYVK
ncbi:MAG: hypothetical protein KC713_09280, partial [Candidatus Omnitrophica bacterium]|nr:hypothetical protein [Candidatus Omnitrophota bacterium]